MPTWGKHWFEGYSAFGTNAKCRLHRAMSVFEGKAEYVSSPWFLGKDPRGSTLMRASVICPSGKKTFARENLSSPARENIPLRDCPKSHVQFPLSRPEKGRIAIVTDVGQGMRWTQQCQAQSWRGRKMLQRTAKSCGSGAPMQALNS
jgi:hypothetical protein